MLCEPTSKEDEEMNEGNDLAGIDYNSQETINKGLNRTLENESDDSEKILKLHNEEMERINFMSEREIQSIILGDNSNDAEALDKAKATTDTIVTNENAVDNLSENLENLCTPSSEEFTGGSQSTQVSSFSLKGRYYNKKNIRGEIDVMTPNVVAALDNCKISYRKSVHIIAAIADALGYDPQKLILNATSFRRVRGQIRQKMSENIKILFQQTEIKYLTVHFDGKIVPDTFTGKKIDRFPILVSTNGDIQKIIDMPALEDGKGATQANAIYEALKEWGLCDAVQALCCDTTNANLGTNSGAAVILESLLEKDLLYLPCRLHIMEIILSSCFELKFPGTSGPNVQLFKRFQSSWPEIITQNYEDGLSNINVLLRNNVSEIVQFIENFLAHKMPRDDYRELLELSMKFLGKGSDTTFKKPGACHHARWMSKAIYSLKMYLFRQSFKLSQKEVNGLFDICQFLSLFI